ncbi:MAG: hypothetical protein AABX17_02140 [Nanoarchaeota archaeon]
MISLNFLGEYTPIWLMIALIILIYAGLKKIKLPGNNFVLALLSFMLTFLVVSSTGLTEYMAGAIALMSVVLILSFSVLLVLVFVAKDVQFTKPLAIIGFVICMLVIILGAFHQFPLLNHVLPSTSNAGLGSGLSELKDYIYSDTIKNSIMFIVSVVVVGFLLLKK